MSPSAPSGTQPPSAPSVTIVLNGVRDAVFEGCTVQELLARMGLARDRVAVEIDGEIVRKAVYETSLLHEGCRVEVVSFVGGG
jgi:sulfur carrier protein